MLVLVTLMIAFMAMGIAMFVVSSFLGLDLRSEIMRRINGEELGEETPQPETAEPETAEPETT